jgi:hypothetical protein
LIGGVRIGKTFVLRLINQELKQLYNKDLTLVLTKTKALPMASTCKIAFNIDG